MHRTTHRFAWAVISLLLFAPLPKTVAQDEPAEEVVEGGVEETLPAELKPFEPKMKPTEVGVRFTPRMAKAMGRFFTKEMKARYDLKDKQVEAIEDVVSTRLMTFVYDNAELGRDLFENMFETMMENEGRFPKDAAMQFGTMAKPLIPELKEFFTQTAGSISKEMNIKQRLKFTGDVAAATAGIAVFEARMARWEKGQVGNNANPFYDPADHDPSAASQPADESDENPQYRRARQNAERQMTWRADKSGQWEEYLKRADNFYEFDEKQKAAAQAILDDCKKRLEAIKTDEWKEQLTQLLIAQHLTWSAGGSEFAFGPWMFNLDSELSRKMKPIEDLETEFKKRLSGIPTSAQRAQARERIRKAMAENGLDKLPI